MSVYNIQIRFCLISLWCLIFTGLQAGEGYGFRVYLKDKGNTGCNLDNPEAYLSVGAIERRIKRGTSVCESDFPISSAYMDTLKALGVKPVVKSKWFSTVVVEAKDSLISEKLNALSIVDSVKWVWKGTIHSTPNMNEDSSRLTPYEKPTDKTYGYGENQIKMLNGIKLHEKGFRGEGMKVAVIDAGFMNVDRIGVFDSLKLLGTHNVVFPDESVFVGDDHGTKVLSCMAANAPGIMIGTAPDAYYWLIKSEDSRSEYPIEEDYWAAAVEFADSVGVDVISSSLGYFNFDSDELNYNTELLDGKTAFITRAAEKAAEKGMLVFTSAGNEGNGSWGKITFPSDAESVMTVGAITENKKKSIFSSIGFTADYRVKPNVVALGSGCTVIDASGNLRYANGTSFSTPIVAGLGACLWQALPWLSNQDVIDLIQKVSTQYNRPDAELGYGIPDVYKAYKEGQTHASKKK